MKFLGDDSLPIDVTKDERMNETFGRDSLGKYSFFFWTFLDQIGNRLLETPSCDITRLSPP